MTVLILYAVTAAVFLILDSVMLTTVMQPLFKRHIGAEMLENIRIVPAALFYLAYVAGLVWLVSLPALREAAPGQALLKGAVVGLMAYGTYEFTSYAIMKNWSPVMVATDVTWGAVLTAVSAWAGVTVVRWIG